ncbi:hypothetical protein NE237_005655 [Protea cynaroides]|uniref:Uncharacterized protein n=1 Tax=Protea cynaroides TaxID=273540 RepID=A0A9Q0KLL4_9MAGN|nr:hypothetical protein NE237_005655 [Protea cynaroides]
MVNLAELALFNVKRAFGDMGWFPVITYDACTRPNLVRQFYCNLQVVGDYNDVKRGHELRITSYVKGVNISFDYRQLADLLGISYDGPMVFYAPGEPQFFSLQMRAEIDNQLLRPDRWQMRACYMRQAPRTARLPSVHHYAYYDHCYVPSHTGNLPYGRMITMLLTRLGVDLVDEKIQEKTSSSPLDWEAICKMDMRNAQVSDEERNAMVRPYTRVEIEPWGRHTTAFASHSCGPGAATSYATGPSHEAGHSHAAGPSHPPFDMMEMLHEIREAQRRSDMRMEELLDAQCVRVDELIDAQRTSDMRMGELIDAQRTADMRMGELIDAQHTSDMKMGELIEAQR